MRFELTGAQTAWQSKGAALGHELSESIDAADVVGRAARVGLLGGDVDLLSASVAVEHLACASGSAAVAFAVQVIAAFALRGDRQYGPALARGEMLGAMSLTAEETPREDGGQLTGRVSWVMPITAGAIAIVGGARGSGAAVFAVPLDATGVVLQPVAAAGLPGLQWAHLDLDGVNAVDLGPTVPVMARVRVLMASVGLGLGRRALDEALAAARATGGSAPDEQTVQGLLADAATELDAARLLTWKAAADGDGVLLGDASLAKLFATGAAQRAVERATQVIGAETFRRGHVIEQLAQDVRALELFAGRTETLRASAAAEILPRGET